MDQSTATPDPWDWTVDDIIQNLCYSSDIWNERPNSRRPNPATFEQVLRNNAIDGPTVMNDVDLNVLKSEFGLAALGERSAIGYAIEILRNQSIKYHSHRASVTSRHIRIDQQAHNYSPAPTPPPSVCLAPADGSTTLASTTTSPTAPSAATLPALHGNAPPLTSSSDLQPPAITGKKRPAPTEPRARAGEIIVTDQDKGRKRRKLLLQPAQTSKLSKRQIPDSTYLGERKLLVNEIFFDSTLATKGEGDPTDSQSDSDDEFYITGAKTPQGRQSFVGQRIRHFLRTEAVPLSSVKSVSYPYPESVIVNNNARHATLFLREEDGKVRVVRRDATILDHDLMGNVNGGNDFDYLIKKFPSFVGHDYEMPALGDSDDEETQSYIAEVEEEAKEKEEKLRKATSVLSTDEAMAVVNDATKALENRWINEKRPQRERKALKTWKQAKGHKRLSKLAEARQEVGRLSLRLSKMRTEICEDEWRKKEDLQTQCACMEVSVFDKMDALFVIETLESSTPPPAPGKDMERQPQPQKNVRPNPMSDEESLHSDTDVDDHLSDFVEIDDVQVLASPGNDDNDMELDPPQIHDHSAAEELEAVHNAEGNIASPEPDIREPIKEEKKHTSRKSRRADSLAAASNDSILGSPRQKGNSHPSFAETFASIDIIDLTASSPMVSPSLPPIDFTPNGYPDEELTPLSPPAAEDDFSANPEDATDEDIASWDWTRLDENSDRKRIVIKILHGLDPKHRTEVEKQFLPSKDNPLRDKISDGLRAMRRRVTRIDGYSDTMVLRILTTTRMYVCWIEAAARYRSGSIPNDTLNNALKMVQFSSFYKFVRSVIRTVQAAGNSEDEGDPDTPRKRGRQVIQDHNARMMRKAAHERRDQAIEMEKQIISQLGSSSFTDATSAVFINPVKMDDEDFIYVHEHIAARLKPHQINGLRFMWREIVEGGGNGARSDGCLLAHTMGLGKTMQTIALLNTIADAGASQNIRIKKQIPRHLRQSRTLILCPASLIANWREEFEKWTPADAQNLGIIYDVTAAAGMRQRVEQINMWHALGGVLIVGYEMFSKLVTNTANRKTGVTRHTAEESAELQRLLLDGPNIIVADEAHRLRNDKTIAGTVAKRFLSTSRIALTGSPLANNLQDYFSMIDWVAPGFLGDREEFNADYRKPIEDGNYQDSSPYDRRKSMRKLNVLKREIDPKVHRADITALAQDLRGKTEFVIKLALTRVQRMAYSRFVQSLRSHGDSMSQMALLDWISVLTLLCNHPAVFIDKLRERRKVTQEKQRTLNATNIPSTAPAAINRPNVFEPLGNTDLTTSGTGYDGTPSTASAKKARKARHGSEELNLDDDVDIATLGLSDTMLETQEKIFGELTQGFDPYDPQLSYKASIVKEILIGSKRVGDRVLIFSHYLPVLNYLETLISTLKPRMTSLRLDGKTIIADRQPMVARFNRGGVDVFLISTRAGGLGLNITGANRVILMDFSWNPSWEEQAVGRAYRIGQEKKVVVYHMVTGGTFEEKLHHITLFKRQLSARAVDSKNPRAAAQKKDELLFEPREVAKTSLDHVLGLDDVFDKVLESPIGQEIRDVTTAETLHAESNEKLTEEEEQQADNEFQLRQMRVSDPQGYQKAREEEQAQLLRTRVVATTPYGGSYLPVYSATQPAGPVPSLGLLIPPASHAGQSWPTWPPSGMEFERGGVLIPPFPALSLPESPIALEESPISLEGSPIALEGSPIALEEPQTTSAEDQALPASARFRDSILFGDAAQVASTAASPAEASSVSTPAQPSTFETPSTDSPHATPLTTPHETTSVHLPGLSIATPLPATPLPGLVSATTTPLPSLDLATPLPGLGLSSTSPTVESPLITKGSEQASYAPNAATKSITSTPVVLPHSTAPPAAGPTGLDGTTSPVSASGRFASTQCGDAKQKPHKSATGWVFSWMK